MIKTLFRQPYDSNDPYWVIKAYFDTMYGDGYFKKSVSYILERDSFHVDGAYCNFPDMNSCYEEEHFEGVEFAIGYPPTEEDTVIVSEEICYQYVRLACERYVKLHPEDAEKIKFLLDTISN
nr:ribonuclease toxin immunity protein CdiI [Pectobacterium aquaticum]